MRVLFSSLSIPTRSAKRLKSLFSVKDSLVRQWTAEVWGYRDWHELRQCANAVNPSPLDEECSPKELEERHAYQIERLSACLKRSNYALDAETVIALWRPTAARPQEKPVDRRAFVDKMREDLNQFGKVLQESTRRQVTRRQMVEARDRSMDAALKALDILARSEGMPDEERQKCVELSNNVKSKRNRLPERALNALADWEFDAARGDIEAAFKAGFAKHAPQRIGLVEGNHLELAAVYFRLAASQDHICAAMCLGLLLQECPDLEHRAGEGQAWQRKAVELWRKQHLESDQHDAGQSVDDGQTYRAVFEMINQAVRGMNEEIREPSI